MNNLNLGFVMISFDLVPNNAEMYVKLFIIIKECEKTLCYIEPNHCILMKAKS